MSETKHTLPSLGKPLNRVDGRLKVTGRAPYAAEVPLDKMAYGVIVQSSIPRGQIAKIDTDAASKAPGVIAVLTHENAAKLPQGGKAGVRPPGGRVLSLLQDNAVRYNGEPIALVIAETFEQATHAAALVQVEYQNDSPVLDLQAALATSYVYPYKIFGVDDPETKRGDVEKALLSSNVRVDQTYTTPVETHNAMEPHATAASWDGGKLTLYDSTQYVYGVRRFVAKTLGIPDADVRVLSPFIGGGFGSKGASWSHVVLAAMAARHVQRPVKIVLSRKQMFGLVGARPYTVQHLTLGADRTGKLNAIRHIATSSTARFEDWLETCALVTRMLYSCPNVETSHRLAKLDIGSPTFNRGPGESPGTFALESAMDELAERLDLDPIEIRLRNYAERDEQEDLPFSSKSLRECYRVGAERFGWSRRPRSPRSMRDGKELIGMGMATATYPSMRMPASCTARMNPDGSVVVRAATHDLGTGTYTVMTQIAAEALRVPVDRIRMEIGDSDLPENPISAGSFTAASTGTAVHLACCCLREKAIRMGLREGESYEALIARNGGKPIEETTHTQPGEEEHKYSSHAFGSIFAEVRVDEELGTIRVARMAGVYAAGRILNVKTARSQMIGGITYGLGMALFEETAIDKRSGRYLNADLSEYLVPVNADVPEIDIAFVEEDDPHVNPIGVKGIGEIPTTGVAAAVANAVYHATGVRVRDLPITLDKVLQSS